MKQYVLLCLLLSWAIVAWPASDQLQVTLTGVPLHYQKTLKSILSLTQYRAFSLSSSLNLKTAYQEGFKELSTQLQQFGYFNSRITGDINYQKSTHLWLITYSINLGPPMIIRQVNLTVNGNGVIKKAIKNYITTTSLQPDDTLNLNTYDDTKDKLLLLANQYGYFDATLSHHQIIVNRTQNTAIINLTLTAGQRYLIAKTTFKQHPNILSQSFLQRFLPYHKGKFYKQNYVGKLQRGLEQSDYFAGVVVTPHPNHKTKTVPIVAHLRAQKPFEYSLGAGYGTDTGIRGLLGWKWRYLTRSGQYLNAQIQTSKIYTIFSANYVFPGTDPLKEATRIHASRGQTDITAYNAIESLLGISKTMFWGKFHTTIGISQHWINYNTAALGKDRAVRYLLPDLSLGYKHRSRKPGDYWHQGWSAAFNVTGTYKNPLSTSSFAEASIEFRESLNLTQSTRIYARETGGGITVPGAITDLSPTLRFYAGGTNSIRGFNFKSLSPEDNDGNPIGGRYMLTGSINLGQRIIDNWSANIFYDTGTTFNTPVEITVYRAAGFGLGWRSPIGPINIYLAHPIHDPNGSWHFDISLGAFL